MSANTKPEHYELGAFISDLRSIASENLDEREILCRVGPLAKKVALDKSWLKPEHYDVNSGESFRSNLLHVEEDQSLFVVAVSWLPGKGTPAHDHGTWAVVVGVDGPERNVFWNRIDDGQTPGYAKLEMTENKVMLESDVVAMPAGMIHSVKNESDQTTLSFHVYGKHLNHTGRSQFNPDRCTERPFLIQTR
ncbi:cysteine dioxygenase family protein [Gammaproteobacteria bacterium]|nr:cysteine dioxygenase family protein [Gammaproteobacteria bacterium]